MDWTSLAPWIAGSLNGSDISALDSWTETELFQFAEEALHAIGGRFLLIAVYDDTSIALVADQGIYELPKLHIATIFAAADGVALSSTDINELEALDDQYESAASAAAPTSWIANALGLGFIRFYPPKNATGVIALVYQQHPPDMPVPAAGQPLEIKMPAPIGDYLAIKALEEARRRQGDGQMLDAAQAFDNLGQVYEKVMAAYWGDGE